MHFYTLGDYVIRMISGCESACHPTNAAATGFYDLTTGAWNKPLLNGTRSGCGLQNFRSGRIGCRRYHQFGAGWSVIRLGDQERAEGFRRESADFHRTESDNRHTHFLSDLPGRGTIGKNSVFGDQIDPVFEKSLAEADGDQIVGNPEGAFGGLPEQLFAKLKAGGYRIVQKFVSGNFQG